MKILHVLDQNENPYCGAPYNPKAACYRSANFLFHHAGNEHIIKRCPPCPECLELLRHKLKLIDALSPLPQVESADLSARSAAE